MSSDSLVSNSFPIPCTVVIVGHYVQDSIPSDRCHTCSSWCLLFFLPQCRIRVYCETILCYLTAKKSNEIGQVPLFMHTQGDTKIQNFVIPRFIKIQLLRAFYDKLNYSILWLWSNSSRDVIKKLFVSFKQLNRNHSFDSILKNYFARRCGVKKG